MKFACCALKNLIVLVPLTLTFQYEVARRIIGEIDSDYRSRIGVMVNKDKPKSINLNNEVLDPISHRA